jgi:sialate O-acetylesterase
VTAVLLLAAVTFGAPFSDGCVLQRGRPVPVWGLASPGEEVKVVFADKSAVTHAGADGAWRVDLPALEASAEGRELKANGAIVRDVLVGEVWLASGQSNMAFPLRAGNPRGTDRGGALAAGMTRIPTLRYASVPPRRADRPRRDGRIVWHAAVPEELEKHAFSAVGFYFARELAQSLGVPVGVIGASVGATSIDSWIPAERFSFERSPRAGNDPSVYYNGMVAQIVPYASKGFVWYQGERNSDAREWPLYAAKLSVFFASWKEAFENEDLRIRLVQLAPWGRETLPYVWEPETSTRKRTVSSRSSLNRLMNGCPVRAVTFQSIVRTSSPGTYGRTSSNSTPCPLNVEW